MNRTTRLIVGVVAVGGVAFGAALFAASGKKAQLRRALTPEQREFAAQKINANVDTQPWVAVNHASDNPTAAKHSVVVAGGGQGGVAGTASFTSGFEAGEGYNMVGAPLIGQPAATPWVHFDTGSDVSSDHGVCSVSGAACSQLRRCSGSGALCNVDGNCPMGQTCGGMNSCPVGETCLSSRGVILSSANPQAGAQHARLQLDSRVGSNVLVGARGPIFAPSATASGTLTMQIYISGSGGAGYYWRPRDTAGSDTVVANVAFAPNDVMAGDQLQGAVAIDVVPDADMDGPDILALSDPGTGLAYVATGAEWIPGMYKPLAVSVDPVTTTLTYMYDGVLIFTDNSLVSADNIDSIHVRHDNRQPRTCNADGMTVCTEDSDCPNMGDICDSVEKADIDTIQIDIDLIPGACCNGSTCTEVISSMCPVPANNFLGAGTMCATMPCANGRCCAMGSGDCTITAAGACMPPATFTGGYTSCAVNCCDSTPVGTDSCTAGAGEMLGVPDSTTRSGNTSTATGPDCTLFDPDPLYWEKFTITQCANVLVSYCCSGEASGQIRSPVYSTLIKDACPCEDAIVILGADLTAQGFGGTDPDVCPEGNFHGRWVNLEPGTYYLPIYVDDMGTGGTVSEHDYQIQIVTSPCPTGGCCVGGTCVDRDPGTAGIQNGNVVQCNADGGNYIGDGVACNFLCGNGACCLPGGTCENRTATGGGGCNATAMNGNTYFGGITCATRPRICAGGSNQGGPCDTDMDCPGSTCSQFCPPDNDKCSQAATMVDGANPFNNLGALKDGPNDICSFPPAAASPTFNDVWFNYAASCTGNVTITLCGPTDDFDAMLSVYSDTTCPIDDTTKLACSDDQCGMPITTGSWSEVTFAATMGTSYKVRIGGFAAFDEGPGVATVSCAAPMGCPCTTAADCRNTLCADDNACNCAACPAGVCVFTCTKFGNANCDAGHLVNLDDILIVLSGFSLGFAAAPNADVNPCGGNGIINLDDILSTLSAFSGNNLCGCDQNGTPVLCGSIAP